MGFFDGIARIFAAIFLGLVAFRASRRFPAAMAVIGIAAAALAVFGLIHLLTSPNGVEVSFGEQTIGIVRWDARNFDGEYVTDHATARLAGRLDNGNIRISGEIAARPVRIGNTDTISFDRMMADLLAVLEYDVYGAVISIDGRDSAMVASYAAANAVLRRVAEHWAGGDVVDYEFGQDVAVRSMYVRGEDIKTADEAFTTLTARRMVQEAHRVRFGESFYSISRAAGMTLDEIFAANPDINPDAHLPEGQLLLVTRYVPILSVITTSHTQTDEIIPFTTQLITVPNLLRGHQNIVQPGLDGAQRVTREITKTNGAQTNSTIVHTEVLQEPVVEIVHVGQ